MGYYKQLAFDEQKKVFNFSREEEEFEYYKSYNLKPTFMENLREKALKLASVMVHMQDIAGQFTPSLNFDMSKAWSDLALEWADSLKTHKFSGSFREYLDSEKKKLSIS